MALSASFDFVVDRDTLIQGALRKLGVLAEGQAPTTNQYTYASSALNLMLKAWMGKGMPLWQMIDLYVYPLHDRRSLTIGPSGTAKCSLELGLTYLTNAEATSSTAIEVPTTRDPDNVEGTTANSDVIGIELDDGTMHWTTISSGGGTTSLTISSGLASAAAAGNRVYFYTALPQRPIRVVEAFSCTPASGGRRPVETVPFSRMRSQGSLTAEGEIVQVSFEPYMTNSGLEIYPMWPDGSTYLELRVQYPYDDMDASTNDFAFPVQFHEAILYNLAIRLAPEYQIPLEDRKILKSEATQSAESAFDSLNEETTINVYPRHR